MIRKKLMKKWPLFRSMITEGNKRLATAVSKKDMNEIATARALIEDLYKETKKKSINNANTSNLYQQSSKGM